MAQAIVVGGGLAGVSAANTVLECGGKVVLVDKSAFCGGNSTKATSGINGAETQTQKTKKVEETCNLSGFLCFLWCLVNVILACSGVMRHKNAQECTRSPWCFCSCLEVVLWLLLIASWHPEMLEGLSPALHLRHLEGWRQEAWAGEGANSSQGPYFFWYDSMITIDMTLIDINGFYWLFTILILWICCCF